MKASIPYREELTPYRFLERSGMVHSERLAVRDGSREWSYGEWLPRCRRFASALRASGLKKGDRVGFMALNSEPLLLAHFAVPMAGGVLVAMNTRLTKSEVAYIARHAGASLLFYSDALEELTRDVEGPQKVSLGTELEDLIRSGSEYRIDSLVSDEFEPIAIDYTSGTTGRPKGVIYHHRGAYLNAIGLVAENQLSADARMLWTLPMFHCNGWCHTWALVAAGAASICLPQLQPALVWETLEAQRITHFNAAPTVLTMLVNHPSAHRLPVRVRVCTGGAAPAPALLSRMEELNFELVHLYGLTESYGPLTINLDRAEVSSAEDSLLMARRVRQGVGHITASHVRVVDQDMSDVAADGQTIGEIVARGNTLMKGYYRDPEATALAFRGGWFHTGDLAVMYPDGAIEIRDRAKDIVISGGENISTIEVEQVLAAVPGVMECAVVGVQDDVWGEVPVAFVTAEPGAVLTEEEILAHCRAQLAHFKCPKRILFGDLPKTSTGKVEKYVLRETASTLRSPNG